MPDPMSPPPAPAAQPQQTPFQFNMARKAASGVKSTVAAPPPASPMPMPARSAASGVKAPFSAASLQGNLGAAYSSAGPAASAPSQGSLSAAYASAGPGTAAPAASPAMPAAAVTPGQAATGAKSAMPYGKVGGPMAAMGNFAAGVGEFLPPVAGVLAGSWLAGDPTGFALSSRGLPSDHPDAPSFGRRLWDGAKGMVDTMTAPAATAIATGVNGAADLFGAHRPFDKDKIGQGDMLSEYFNASAKVPLNAASRAMGGKDLFKPEDIWRNTNSARAATDRIAAEYHAREAAKSQQSAANAAAAPHTGGDSASVLRPDIQPGSPGGQPTPNPQSGPGRMPTQEQQLDPDNPQYDHVLSQLRMRAGIDNSYVEGPGGNAANVQNLTDYMNAMSGQTTAQAHVMNAKGIGQYQDPGSLEILGAMQGWTPEQMGRVHSAMGHGAPGGEANAGYYDHKFPAGKDKPGEEPMSAADRMKRLHAMLKGTPREAIQAALDAHHSRDELQAAGQPRAWDQTKNFLGFPGGMQEAQQNAQMYQDIYGR